MVNAIIEGKGSQTSQKQKLKKEYSVIKNSSHISNSSVTAVILIVYCRRQSC